MSGPVAQGEQAPVADAFQQAAREPYTIKDVNDAIRKKDADKLRGILATKEVKDLNAYNEHGWTPVFNAVCEDSVECLWQLLAAGANANAQSNNGLRETPISYAVLRHHASVAAVKVLLQYGADPNLQPGESEKLPVLQAAKHGKETLMKLLLDAGANIEGADNAGETAVAYAAKEGQTGVLRILIGRGAALDKHSGYSGFCPLIDAVLAQRRDAFEVLLESGASPAATCKEGASVLMYAAWAGAVSAIEALALHGIDLDAQKENDGCNAMMWAAIGGKKYATEKLLELGANPGLRNNEGKSAANLARENGHDEIAVLIETKAAVYSAPGQEARRSKPFRIKLGAKNGQ